MARLEPIAQQLEGGELELARALALFEEGVEQLRAAADELTQGRDAACSSSSSGSNGTFDVIEPETIVSMREPREQRTIVNWAADRAAIDRALEFLCEAF